MGATTTKAINPRRGDVIQLSCDAHNWMLGWIYTIDHPYFAVVDANGHFQIDDIPPGTYTVKAWHPFLGVQESELNLALNAEAELQFSFAAN